MGKRSYKIPPTEIELASDYYIIIVARRNQCGLWSAFIVNETTTMIRNRHTQKITSTSIEGLKDSIRAEYPRWYGLFRWNGASGKVKE